MNSFWKVTEFEECLDKIKASTKIPKRNFLVAGKFPIISQEEEYINGYWDNEEDVFEVKKSVVIFGDHTKIVKVIDFDFVKGADGVKVLLPKEGIDSYFFAYYLQSINLDDLGYARHYRLLKKEKIPIPPLSEQKQIVSVLDSLSAELGQLHQSYSEQLQSLKELKKSTLQKAFSGELTRDKMSEAVFSEFNDKQDLSIAAEP